MGVVPCCPFRDGGWPWSVERETGRPVKAGVGEEVVEQSGDSQSHPRSAVCGVCAPRLTRCRNAILTALKTWKMTSRNAASRKDIASTTAGPPHLAVLEIFIVHLLRLTLG
jgi:hypothetical protein